LGILLQMNICWNHWNTVQCKEDNIIPSCDSMQNKL
jgi:hypothetical protein